MDIEIEGFDPRNPDFSPSWAVSELSFLPPKAAVMRSAEICVVQKCGLWREMGSIRTLKDHKGAHTVGKEPCSKGPILSQKIA